MSLKVIHQTDSAKKMHSKHLKQIGEREFELKFSVTHPK